MDVIVSALTSIDLEAQVLKGMRILGILVLARVSLMLIRGPIRRLGARLIARGMAGGEASAEVRMRADTVIRLLGQTASIGVWSVTALVVLKEVGVDIGPVLAGAGIVGLAVGFGAQNLVRDVISGFFILLENQLHVGDVAVINGTGGLVEAINLRTIVLRDLAGAVHTFPNGTVHTLSNLTQGWSAYVFEINVAYREDTDRVIEVMRQVGTALKADETFGRHMLEEVEIFGVDALGESAVTIKGRIKTKPIEQWGVGREFIRRVKQAFDAEGIEVPFPQRTVSLAPEAAEMVAALGRQR